MASSDHPHARDPLLVADEGHRDCLLGNEAIVRGALEAGVAFACGYPGTPSSEVTDSFARIAPLTGIEFEYSVNEKIAVEMAFAASLAGARSICAMKHLGLMVAGDPLSTIPYIGTVAGMVIVSAGDPSCRTSPNEQDQRHLGPMLHFPVLDPSTPQEALELARLAFELSEECNLPVLLRPTTRVCHTRGVVRFGRLEEPRVAGFRRDPARFNPVPVNARRMRIELEERLERARAWIARAGLLRKEGAGETAILTAGAPAATCHDILEERGLLAGSDLALITLSALHPLPEEPLAEMLREVRRLLVVEELSPYLEDRVAALASRHGLAIEILGKQSGHLPVEFELEPPAIEGALWEAFGLGAPPEPGPETPRLPPRPPILCAGCPHRATYFAARAAFGEDQLYFNDIGCYTLGLAPPLETSDALLCMGAGFTLAAGVARVTGRRTVGFLGDSTFFHSGMPALLNAIKEDVNMVAVILDNDVTAMTGFQESPTVHIEEEGPERRASIEGVARALGARQVEVIDPHDLAGAISAFERAREAEGLAVIVSEQPCPVYMKREAREPESEVVYEIDPSRCRSCGREVLGTRCNLCGSDEFSRQMSRSRALTDDGAACGPRPAVAPCARACPLNLCIQGYTAHIAAGRLAEAYELIVERLPLPHSVCRVCDRPCEEICVRRGVDDPVAVNDLKRTVMEWAALEPEPPYEPERESPHGRRVAVVGAGPSGLAAAHDLALRGYEVTLFDAREKAGGLLRHGIPRYRLPEEALERDLEGIFRLGVRFAGGMRLGEEVRLGGLLEGGFEAIYLAIGASRALHAELGDRSDDAAADEGLPRVIDALSFLEEARREDCGPPGSRVVVLGGGNSAIDASRTALRLGARSVTVASLEAREEMPAIAGEIVEAEREGIVLCPRTRAKSLRPGGLECVTVEIPGGGAFRLDRVEELPGTEAFLEADVVVVAIGQRPECGFLGEGDPPLDWTQEGRLRVDPETCRSSHPRIFAGGDLAAGEATVVSAIAGGLRAAWGIDRSLRGEEAANRRVPPPLVELERDAAARPWTRARESARVPAPEVDPGERAGSFDEVHLPYSEEQARREAARCMICGLCGACRACIDNFGCPAFTLEDGRVGIDPALCNGCALCAGFCPNGAIVEAPRKALS